MKRTKIILILAAGALGVAGLFGLVAYSSARAAASNAASGGLNFQARAFFDRGGGGGYNNEYLAQALGISVDELNAAIQKAKDAALTQAVEKGLITQAQADQLKEKGNVFPFGGRWEGWLTQNGIDYEALLADALGITVDELQAAYVKANHARIDQAVADGRLTQEQADLIKGRQALFANEDFQSAMRSAFEAAVRQAVANGVITQAQADAILEKVGEMGFRGFRGFGEFGGGRGGGFGRHGGWGAPDDFTKPGVPSSTPSDDI